MIASLATITEMPFKALQPVKSDSDETAGAAPVGLVDSLDGKVLAIIDSDSPGTTEAYFTIALIRKFREHFNLADVIWVKKANRTHPPQPELWQEVLDRADAGIAMYGGCGTCSSRTMRDAIEMEKAGIPAVAIAHGDLRGSIDSMRKISKSVGTPYVLVTRPLVPTGDWGVAETDALVDRLFPEILASLARTPELALKSA